MLASNYTCPYNRSMEENPRTFRCADFFAGIGGFRLGFEQTGRFEVVYSNDNNKYACETYRKNFGEIDCRSITEVDPDLIPGFDVLLAGFPCQPYSMIGKRKGMEDERGQLFFQLIRILNAKRPQAVVLENVKHLKTHSKGEAFKLIKHHLEWLGYKIYDTVLNSADFGVPQHRERLYMVGFLENDPEFVFPNPALQSSVQDILENEVEENFYLSAKYYKGLLKHRLRHQGRGNGFGCSVLNTKGISNTLVSGRMGRERNLIRDEIKKKNGWGIRALSIREAARLQGFPDTFEFPVSNTQAYEQLGNAVTVPVARHIAEELVAKLLEVEQNVPSLSTVEDGWTVRETAPAFQG